MRRIARAEAYAGVLLPALRKQQEQAASASHPGVEMGFICRWFRTGRFPWLLRRDDDFFPGNPG